MTNEEYSGLSNMYDDGYTEKDFQRLHFREMPEAVRVGKINCVIVKNLSWFGREYIEPRQYGGSGSADYPPYLF